jgi:hypothetical protein
MLKAGVIDPTKVVRIALENAASIAGLLITTEAMVAQKPSKAAADSRMSDMGLTARVPCAIALGTRNRIAGGHEHRSIHQKKTSLRRN